MSHLNFNFTPTLEHGLMPQIIALLNPIPNFNIEPTGSRASTVKEERPAFFRKSGRGYNHETCDACGDNGDLLCCENCPASFHLLCSDPPLAEEDVPLKGWICKSCNYMKIQELNEVLMRPRTPRSAKLNELSAPGDGVDISETEETNRSFVELFFSEVMPHIEQMNPTEFRLPPDFAGCFEPAFPGTSRLVFKKSCPAKAKQTIVEMENFIVPRPIAFCYQCQKSCRLGPLVKCDMCPAFYHLDCLNPPLTVPPTTLWSCPLHVETYLEDKLLRTDLLSERVRLWDFVNEEIDGNEVKRNFIRKAKMNGGGMEVAHFTYGKPVTPMPTGVIDSYEYQRSSSDKKIVRKKLADYPEVLSQSMDWMSTTISAKREEEPTPFTGGNLLLFLADVASNIKSEKVELNGQQPSRPDSKIDYLLNNLDLNTIKLLAVQKLHELTNEKSSFSQNDSSNKENMHQHHQPQNQNGNLLLTPPTQTSNYFPKHRVTDAMITLYCLTTAKDYEITKPFVDLGLGSQVDLNLVESCCKNISRRHCTIYYDKVSTEWELINYSVYGTMVNNCLYGFNAARSSEYCTTSKISDSVDEEAQKYFNEIVKKRKCALLEQAEKGGLDKKPRYEESLASGNCKCSRSGVWSGSTWEGAAKLDSGTHIQIGCIKFVVSVRKLYKSDDDESSSDSDDANNSDD